jgi:hypothetical protein
MGKVSLCEVFKESSLWGKDHRRVTVFIFEYIIPRGKCPRRMYLKEKIKNIMKIGPCVSLEMLDNTKFKIRTSITQRKQSRFEYHLDKSINNTWSDARTTWEMYPKSLTRNIPRKQALFWGKWGIRNLKSVFSTPRQSFFCNFIVDLIVNDPCDGSRKVILTK